MSDEESYYEEGEQAYDENEEEKYKNNDKERHRDEEKSEDKDEEKSEKIELSLKELTDTEEQDKEEILEEDWDTEEELLDDKILTGESQEYVGERDEDGLRHGMGKVTFDNNDVYEGQYVKNWKHGYGTYTYNDGSQYVGEWKYGNKNGHGSILYPDGSVYRGQWKDNNRHGYGEYYYTSGDYYLGEWLNDKREGHGSYRFKETGAHYYGNWANNAMDGKGELVLGNCVFIGKFENSRPQDGKLVFESGVEQLGKFVPKVPGNLWKGHMWNGGKVTRRSVRGGIMDLLRYNAGDILMAAEKEAPPPPIIDIEPSIQSKEEVDDTIGYEEVLEKPKLPVCNATTGNVEEILNINS